MSPRKPAPDHQTRRRTEGPTPAGGAYAVAYFSLDGRPVPQRFANQAEIVEYDEADHVIKRTFGTMTPQAALPPNYDADAPVPPSGMDLHGVIEAVLRDAGRCLTTREIRDAIARDDLWRRPADGHFPPTNQISARVSDHKELFARRDRKVCLIDR